MDSDLILKLQEAYLHFSVMENFPMGKCFLVSEQLKKLGLAQESGWFQADSIIPVIGTRATHNWSRIDNIKIDLTASQFNPWLNEPVPKGVLIITPDDPLYRRYLTTYNTMFG